MTLLGNNCQLGTSIGIVLKPAHDTTANAVLNAADNGMYAAKRASKDVIVLATMTK